MSECGFTEPFAVPINYADDAEFEVKDGNLFITYLEEVRGELRVVDRVIMPVKRFRALRAKVNEALSEPHKILSFSP